MPEGPTREGSAPGSHPPEPSGVSAQQPSPVRDRFGNYRLCFEIASGGMASVYLAQSDGPGGFERLVAIKRIHPHLATKVQFTEMFLDEARIAAQINHPNVCRIYDFGCVDNVYYIAMEYLRGETFGRVLATLVRTGRARKDAAGPAFLSRIVAEAAEGLHAAHELRSPEGQELRVVHRDVSPQNIFVNYDGSVRIVDFGIARAENRVHETQTGVRKGKIAFMAPEQVRGTTVDRRADVWALGVVFWELLAGRRLFMRETDVETMLAVIEAPIDLPSKFNPNVPAGLDAVVRKALMRDPDKRYATARELGRALSPFTLIEGHPVGMPEVGEWLTSLFPDGSKRLESLLDRARSATPIHAPISVVPGETSGVIPVRLPSENEEFLPESGASADAETVLRTPASGSSRPHAERAVDDSDDIPIEFDMTRAASEAQGVPTTIAAEPSSPRYEAFVATPMPTPAVGSVLPSLETTERPPRPRRLWSVLPLVAAAIALGAVLSIRALETRRPHVVVLEDTEGVPAHPAARSPSTTPVPPTDPSPEATHQEGAPVAPEPAPAPEPDRHNATPRHGGVASRSERTPPGSPVRARDTTVTTAPAAPGAPTAQAADAPQATLVASHGTPQAESPTAPRREAAARPTGLVNVVVAGGWAEIRVRGQSFGRTPRQLELPAGVQHVTLLPFGQQPAIEREVTVEAGSVARLRVQL